MSDASTEPTLGEIGRALERIERTVTDMRREMRQDYVRRDVYDADRTTEALAHSTLDARVNALGVKITDVEASLERHWRSHASTWRSWMQPILLTLITVLITLTITYLLTGGPR